MGSKRWMLQNGLGEILRSECSAAERFVDLFAGSGAVACYVAQNCSLPVLASDLQEFSVVLTRAIIARQSALDIEPIWTKWLEDAVIALPRKGVPAITKLTRVEVHKCRDWSGTQKNWPITRAYGGHYFSPKQALWLDSLRRHIPKDEPSHTVALAALIDAASRCAASPGHTAQPFQPTRTAKRHLKEAWEKDVCACTHRALQDIARQFANRKGDAIVADASLIATTLSVGDIAFIDPPYSGVHYSRFYHVLETIAQGQPGDVSGVGRYPSRNLRPQSKFSVKTHSLTALEHLLRTIAEKGARAVVTFPDHECSNGLSGSLMRHTAAKFFHVTVKMVERKFSTLGGNNKIIERTSGRKARKVANELILVLRPRE